jgi:hypothetical protein
MQTIEYFYSAHSGYAYFVDGDMFYGQDHLELVDRACMQAFAGQWPPP